MTITWNLTHVMYEKGIFTVTELKRAIQDKGNLDISIPAVHRLVNKLPNEIKFSTLDALCAALECDVNDLLVHQKPTVANLSVQPLVLESEFKPPKKIAKKKEKQSKIKTLPPI